MTNYKKLNKEELLQYLKKSGWDKKDLDRIQL